MIANFLSALGGSTDGIVISFLKSESLPSHRKQKNECLAWMILISSGSAGPDFLKWFKDF